MEQFKAGWTDCKKHYRRAHKYEEGEDAPLCNYLCWYGIIRHPYDPVTVRPPKHACKNCLGIDGAMKKKKGRKSK